MDYTEIRVSDFFNDVKTSFSRQQVVVMMANRLSEWEDNEKKRTPESPVNRIKGLPFHVRGERYLIPISDIQQYFKNNPKPQKAMTPEEELEFLRKENKKLEEKLKANVSKPTTMKDETSPPPPNTPEEPEVLEPTEIPEQDEAIPSKTSEEEIQKELKALVKGKQPLTKDTRTKK